MAGPDVASGDPTLVLLIEGMMCMKNCGTTVQNALRSVPGVIKAEVSFDEKVARVWGSAGLSPMSLIEAVECVGFGADVLPQLVSNGGGHTASVAHSGTHAHTPAGARTPTQQSTYVDVLMSPVKMERKHSLDSSSRSSFSTPLLPSGVSSSSSTSRSHQSRRRNSSQNSNGSGSGVVSGSGGGRRRKRTGLTVLEVEGMMCMKNCGTTVQNALKAVPGVTRAEVSFEEKVARVWASSDVHAQTLIDTVEGVGFDARLLSETLVSPEMDDSPRKGTSATAGAPSSPSSFHGSPTRKPLLSTTTTATAAAKEQEPHTDDITADIDSLVKSTFSVTGMTCASCVKNVDTIVKDSVAGVRSVKIALLAESMEVTYDATQASESSIVGAVEAVGYGCKHVRTEALNASAHTQEFKLEVGGMSCAACSGKIERTVAAMPGVQSVAVSLSTAAARVVLAPSFGGAAVTGIRDVIEKIESLGYEARLVTRSNQVGSLQESQAKEAAHWARLFTVSMAFMGPMMLVMWIAPRPVLDALHSGVACGGSVDGMSLWAFLVASVTQFYCGRRFYINAYKGLRHGNYGMDLLVVLGTSVSYFYSLIVLMVTCATGPEVDMAMPQTMAGAASEHYHTHTSRYFFETAAMLLTFVSLGKWMESRVKGETSRALTTLASLQPKTALLVSQPNADPREIELSLVKAGDLLRVLPGAAVPTDGVVVDGASYVDESMLTGEVMPVIKQQGEMVLGGTTNQHGTFLMKATSVGLETVLSQILTLVHEAQLSKPPIQHYADRVSSVFTPSVMTIATISFFVWLSAASAGQVPSRWMMNGGHVQSPFVFALMFWISVVTVACPCALGLATPTAVMVGTGVGARHGILIKGGDAFQAAHEVTAVIFDKTGTLTTGKAVVTEHLALDPDPPAAAQHSSSSSSSPHGQSPSCVYGAATATGGMNGSTQHAAVNGSAYATSTANGSPFSTNGSPVMTNHGAATSGVSGVVAANGNARRRSTNGTDFALPGVSNPVATRRMVALAAAVEQGSEHPIAQAVIRHARAMGVEVAHVKDYDIEPGLGIAGEVEGAGRVCVGNQRYLEEIEGIEVSSAARAGKERMESGGKTVILVGLNGRLIGLLAVSDRPRPEAKRTVAALQRMGMQVWMVTGDSLAAAKAVALEMGIQDVQANTLPGQKAKRVKALQAQGHKVAMVGDGINDSPALAQADVGVAIGAGAQVACEAADMVIVKNSIEDVVVAFDLARTVFGRIKLNFVWAMGYNALGIPLAAGVFLPIFHWRLPPAFSGLAMVLSSVSVVLSSLSMRLYRPPKLDDVIRRRMRITAHHHQHSSVSTDPYHYRRSWLNRWWEGLGGTGTRGYSNLDTRRLSLGSEGSQDGIHMSELQGSDRSDESMA